jgi:hypothetical protein
VKSKYTMESSSSIDPRKGQPYSRAVSFGGVSGPGVVRDNIVVASGSAPPPNAQSISPNSFVFTPPPSSNFNGNPITQPSPYPQGPTPGTPFQPSVFNRDTSLGPSPSQSIIDNARSKLQGKKITYTMFVKGYGGILLLIMVAVVAIVTFSFTISFSNQSSDVAGGMMVLTGHRTRDWTSTNSYSMYSSDEDQYTRLYVCMKASGITVPGDPVIPSIGDFRAAARKHHDCGAASDGGWPRDYGFMRCIQRHFNADFHQSNVFLKCLDLSEGYMVESIQTPASFIFLGSYNFVTMLLTCMGIITAFLMFTAGGYYTLEELYEVDGHAGASVFWSPLTWGSTLIALIWSVFMFMATMIYAFPPNNMWSDAADGTAGALPGTPWTGFICVGVSLMMVLYFTSCLTEILADKIEADTNASHSNRSNKKNDEVERFEDGGGNFTLEPTHDASSEMYRKSGQGVNDGSSREYVSHIATFSRDGYSRIPTQLGIRYNNQLYYTGRDGGPMRIAPLMNKAFSLTWVFADGLLFIGMLNSQNSLLNEDVVAIWYYIILCRGFQLAASYFMDDVLFIDAEPREAAENENESTKLVNGTTNYNRSEERKAHAGIAVACSHLSSLWCMIIVLYRFRNAIAVTDDLNTHGVSNPIHGLQVSFLVIIAAMDVFKHVIAFLTIFGYFKQQIYFLIIEATFNADWFIRSIFIIATLFTVPQYLGDINFNLYSYIMLSIS